MYEIVVENNLQPAVLGSRELDGRIATITDFHAEDDQLSWRDHLKVCGWETALVDLNRHTSIWSSVVPRWTTSVDAAMTLIPDGWTVSSIRQDSIHWYVILMGDECTEGSSRTLPLAICIAALKAMDVENANAQK